RTTNLNTFHYTAMYLTTGYYNVCRLYWPLTKWQEITIRMLPNAPLWRRLGALIYDSFLLFGLLMLFGGIAVGIESLLFGKSYVETSSTAGGNFLVFTGMLMM